MPEPDSHNRPLAGRKALVTGASRRLGRAMTLALAQAGADVIVHHRSDASGAETTAADVRESGVRAEVMQADLGEASACTALVDASREALGGLDLLVNNAAIFERTPLEVLKPEDFDLHMRVNAASVHALSLHAGRHMLASGGGDIVNIACVAAWRPYKAYVPYSASKAAVMNLTQGFAKLFAPTVRVNAIAPGPILPPAGADEAQAAAAAESTLLKRYGHPDDIAAALLFFLRASYVTGFTLAVDGGRSIV